MRVSELSSSARPLLAVFASALAKNENCFGIAFFATANTSSSYPVPIWRRSSLLCPIASQAPVDWACHDAITATSFPTARSPQIRIGSVLRTGRIPILFDRVAFGRETMPAALPIEHIRLSSGSRH